MIAVPDTDYVIGISGKHGKPDCVPENAILLDQVHSNRIVFDPHGGESADGMVFARGSRAVPCLKVADCLPVFAVWDGFTGAAHAGWRGLADGIIENLLKAVDRPLRYLVLGPCICGECYRVGESVRRRVCAGDPAAEDGHPSGRVDLRASALRRARHIAGNEFKLINIDKCTLELTSFYSYRANGTEERNFLWLAETRPGEHIRQPYNRCDCYSPERRKN